MEQRLDFYRVSPEGVKIFSNMDKHLENSVINSNLQELVRIRISQINQCAFCLTVHTKAALKANESEKRINGLNAWRDCSFYTEKEKTALELAEHITLISEKRVPDDLYRKVRQFYNEKEYLDLVFTIIDINGWNRMSISMGIIAE